MVSPELNLPVNFSVVFENRILSEYLGPRGMREGSGEGSTMRNFIVCTVHLI